MTTTVTPAASAGSTTANATWPRKNAAAATSAARYISTRSKSPYASWPIGAHAIDTPVQTTKSAMAPIVSRPLLDRGMGRGEITAASSASEAATIAAVSRGP